MWGRNKGLLGVKTANYFVRGDVTIIIWWRRIPWIAFRAGVPNPWAVRNQAA